MGSKGIKGKSAAANTVLQAIQTVLQARITCENEEALGKVCLAAAQELTGSKFGFIGELNAVGRFDTIALSNPGWDECLLDQSEAVVFINDMGVRGIWGEVIKTGKSLIANDPPSHPDSVGVPKGHPPLTSFLGAPLKRNGSIIGMVAMANKTGGYGQADQDALESLSLAMVDSIFSKRAEDALARQSQEILELATPVIQVWQGVVAVPLIGMLDSGRTMHFMDRFLKSLVDTKSSLALVDITGVPSVDTQTAQYLVEAISAAKLLGVKVILTGVRPSIAQTMVQLGIQLSGVDTRITLAAGLKLCFENLGLAVVPAEKNAAK